MLDRAKFEERKKRIRELELKVNRKQKQQKMNQLYLLASKAGILELSSNHLHGAFLEIAESATHPDTLRRWNDKYERIQSSGKKPKSFIITFKTPPSKEIKRALREKKFLWNSFRGECHGSGDIESVKDVLKNIDHEVLPV